jgi:hypothetical protein
MFRNYPIRLPMTETCVDGTTAEKTPILTPWDISQLWFSG